MSTLRTTTLKHGSSAIDNIVFDNQGRSTFGSNALFVNAQNQRVGVNTTSPTVALDVVGGINTTGNVNVGGQLNLTGNFTVDTNVLFIDTTNNRVGINTSAPSAPLHVNGTALIGATGTQENSGYQLEVRAGGNATLKIQSGSSSTSYLGFGTQSNGLSNNISVSNNNDLWVVTVAGSQRVYIDSNGNVGLSQNSPQGKLDIATATGESIVFDSAGASQQPRINLNRAGGSDYSLVNSLGEYKIFQNTTEIYRYASNAHTWSSNTVSNIVRFGSNGNVGIGNIDPQRKLVVSDGTNSGFEFYPNDSGGGNTLNSYRRNTSSFVDLTLTFDELILARAAGEVARFNTGGDLAFIDGGGIDFSAVAGGSSTNSIFDDYEEGTWIPQIFDANTGGNQGTATIAQGYYIKVGHTVHCTYRLSGMNFTGMTNSAALRIRNWPYQPSPSSKYPNVGSFTGAVQLQNVDVATGSYYVIGLSSNGTYATLVRINDAAASNSALITYFDGTSEIRGSMTYLV